MGPSQTHKLLHSKGNHKQDEKTTYGLRETFANDVTDEGLISKIYKRLIQLRNNNKNQTTQSKTGQKTQMTFLQRRPTDAQQADELRENCKSKLQLSPAPASQDGRHTVPRRQMREAVGEREPSHRAGGGTAAQHHGK